MLLLVTYGLRGREVAALTLDDIDWKRERLAVPERKAGHSTAFPLSPSVGEAIVDYLQHGRPADDRPSRVLPGRGSASGRSGPPRCPRCARHYLLKAGIDVSPARARTRCATPAVQRLVDADFDLKTIGDFVGHRSAALHRDLRQGRRRGAARGRPRRRRGRCCA